MRNYHAETQETTQQNNFDLQQTSVMCFSNILSVCPVCREKWLNLLLFVNINYYINMKYVPKKDASAESLKVENLRDAYYILNLASRSAEAPNAGAGSFKSILSFS